MKRKLRRLEQGISAAVVQHAPTARWTPQGKVVWIPVLLDPQAPVGKFRVENR